MSEGKEGFVAEIVEKIERYKIEKARAGLTKAIGIDAVEYPERKGLVWEYIKGDGYLGDDTNRAYFLDGNHFVIVGKREIDLEESQARLINVYKNGAVERLIDQYVEPRKIGVSVAFHMSGENTADKAFTTTNASLAEGSVGFLRDLVGFTSLIKGNVFLCPSDERRSELYQKFFTGSKFNESFRGTYFLFQPSPTEIPTPVVG